jgi:hypothetical protein
MDVRHPEQEQMHSIARPSGWTVFAGSILLLAGFFNVIWGVVALLRPRAITVTSQGLVIWDFKAMGWTYIVVGLLMIAISFGLFLMREWARWLAIVIAGLNALVQVVYFPAYPLWSLLVIILDVLVIWQLSTRWRPEPGSDRGTPSES